MVGAGAAGLEAARVAAERGHAVTVLEAASQAGGQVRLAAQNPRRKELIGIVDWRVAELERLGVEIRYDVWAEQDDVLALSPDIVIVATGGLPQNPPLEAGGDLVTSSWDIIAGAVKPAEDVLLYDDNGGHQGMTAAELIANAGAKLELVSPERFFAPEMGGMNHVPYMRAFHEKGVRVTINTRLKAVRRDGNQLVATLGSDFAGLERGAPRRSGRRRARHAAARRSLFRAEAAVEEWRRGRLRAAGRRRRHLSRDPAGGRLHAVPDRRRGRRPQHPRRDL